MNKINSAYNFDHHLRISAVNCEFKIKGIPIETFYRTESSSYNIKYSLNFLKYLASYILEKNYRSYNFFVFAKLLKFN